MPRIEVLCNLIGKKLKAGLQVEPKLRDEKHQSSLKKSTAQISVTDKFGPNVAEYFE